MHAQFALFDGFDPLDVLGPYETLLAGSAAASGRITAEFAAADGPREVPSGVPGVALRATATVDPERADLLVVPGAAPGPADGPVAEAITEVLAEAARSPLGPLLVVLPDHPESASIA
ncbi:DJ-1/PfpI family protein, partial [Saccharopolyspora sp. NPDC047091]